MSRSYFANNIWAGPQGHTVRTRTLELQGGLQPPLECNRLIPRHERPRPWATRRSNLRPGAIRISTASPTTRMGRADALTTEQQPRGPRLPHDLGGTSAPSCRRPDLAVPTQRGFKGHARSLQQQPRALVGADAAGEPAQGPRLPHDLAGTSAPSCRRPDLALPTQRGFKGHARTLQQRPRRT